MHSAILKYGPEAFTVSTIGQFNEKQAATAEQLFISELHTKAPDGYNLTDGGEGASGLRLSDDAKAKLRAAQLGRKCPPRSAEHRMKLSLALSGKKKTPEHRAAMSRTRVGRKHSPEWCQQHSERMRGTKNPNYRHGRLQRVK